MVQRYFVCLLDTGLAALKHSTGLRKQYNQWGTLYSNKICYKVYLLAALFNETGVHGNTALQNVRGLLKNWGSLTTKCFNWFLCQYIKKYMNIIQHYNSLFTVQSWLTIHAFLCSSTAIGTCIYSGNQTCYHCDHDWTMWWRWVALLTHIWGQYQPKDQSWQKTWLFVYEPASCWMLCVPSYGQQINHT